MKIRFSDPELPAVQVNAPAGRDGLWTKTIEAFQYVHRNYHGQYDWVIKADDDT